MKRGPNLQHQAKKRFGQNFLQDQGVINAIVRAVHPQEGDNLVEIGPGQGAITGLLLEHCPNLQVIELDKDLIPGLLAQFAKFRGFKIHQTDALNFDFSRLSSTEHPLRIVGNLPYNISTPLIFHLLSFREQVRDMHFMLQKEVVERLAASPGEKNYGRLSIMAQYFCQVENLFEVPPECFIPAPKVDSAIVRLVPHKELPVKAHNMARFETLVKTAFAQRRKTLRNSLKSFEIDFASIDVKIDLAQRAENLSLEQYVNLSNALWPEE
ncbi:16S rRNA (adenine(1518)-N(6)/adenine(1519)-N(6))-dimethyltransferase RsmA [Teredinibacter turnerae]|uniref:16S rRNA (adenine(1518)-N(6)/adenine(1519)-N(6))- dimethyltransferase RsmA n=1 Tax=Teredinibacter turnerae TaxID=2426 RepID=UPI0003625800|nr:16S rRNA (adenine(1518)-N(6)/adenine(1519)-N(6))-dimethyltransferase RsmA [Teredinibacter turnerae]